MTLEEARKIFESDFTVYPEVGVTSKAPTGEPYREIMSGFIVGADAIDGEHEGFVQKFIPRDEKPPLYRSENQAIKAWLASVQEYAKAKGFKPNRGTTLYWRIPPECDKHVYHLERVPQEPWMEKQLWVWKVYARLLISDKPRTPPTITELEAILNSVDDRDISINPDGTVTANEPSTSR